MNEDNIDITINIVVHSATKYLGGHSDLSTFSLLLFLYAFAHYHSVAGSITVSTPEQAETIFKGIKLFGGICAPQVSTLL